MMTTPGNDAITTMGERQRGTVLRLVHDKGFGFIGLEEAGEVFFHATGLEGTTMDELTPGMGVTFVVIKTARGPRAMEVRREEWSR